MASEVNIVEDGDRKSESSFDSLLDLEDRRDRELEAAIKATWGYDLYEALVDFPPEMLSALRTNAPPTTDAVHTAISFREEPTIHMSRINTRKATIDAQLDALKKERESLEKESAPHLTKLRGCEAILSPIRRLPIEILSEISQHALPTHPHITIRQAPLSLCRVCSAWRTAVLSLPALWSTLYINVMHGDDFTRKKRQILRWFKRGKQHPLSFFLHIGSEVLEDSDLSDETENFLSRLSPVIAQARHLGLSAGTETINELLPSLLEVPWNVGNLESLALKCIGTCLAPGFEFEDSLFPIQVFNGARNLRRLVIDEEFVNITGADSVLPWSQLTHVVLTQMLTIGNWVAAMELCPQLQCGDFIIAHTGRFRERDLEALAEQTRVHKNLEDLRIWIYHPYVSAVALLSLFELPKLRKLDVYHADGGACPEAPPASIFQNFNSLQSLTLDDGWEKSGYYDDASDYDDSDPPTINGILDILRQTANLKEFVLTIHDPDFYYPLFDAMTHDRNSELEQMLPGLTVLRIHAHDLSSLDLSMLAGMVKSRCVGNSSSGCKQLEEFCVSASGWCDLEQHQIAELEGLLSPCVDLRFNTNQHSWNVSQVHVLPFDGWAAW